MADLDPATLHEHYAEMPDGELLSLASEAESLEAAARRLLDSELQRRGLAQGDVATFQAEARAETLKAERARRKRMFRILFGAGGPWERAYSIWKWATLAAFGTGYVVRLFGCRKPLMIVGCALVGSLVTPLATTFAAHRLTPRHKK